MCTVSSILSENQPKVPIELLHLNTSIRKPHGFNDPVVFSEKLNSQSAYSSPKLPENASPISCSKNYTPNSLYNSSKVSFQVETFDEKKRVIKLNHFTLCPFCDPFDGNNKNETTFYSSVGSNYNFHLNHVHGIVKSGSVVNPLIGITDSSYLRMICPYNQHGSCSEPCFAKFNFNYTNENPFTEYLNHVLQYHQCSNTASRGKSKKDDYQVYSSKQINRAGMETENKFIPLNFAYFQESIKFLTEACGGAEIDLVCSYNQQDYNLAKSLVSDPSTSNFSEAFNGFLMHEQSFVPVSRGHLKSELYKPETKRVHKVKKAKEVDLKRTEIKLKSKQQPLQQQGEIQQPWESPYDFNEQDLFSLPEQIEVELNRQLEMGFDEQFGFDFDKQIGFNFGEQTGLSFYQQIGLDFEQSGLKFNQQVKIGLGYPQQNDFQSSPQNDESLLGSFNKDPEHLEVLKKSNHIPKQLKKQKEANLKRIVIGDNYKIKLIGKYFTEYNECTYGVPLTSVCKENFIRKFGEKGLKAALADQNLKEIDEMFGSDLDEFDDLFDNKY